MSVVASEVTFEMFILGTTVGAIAQPVPHEQRLSPHRRVDRSDVDVHGTTGVRIDADFLWILTAFDARTEP